MMGVPFIRLGEHLSADGTSSLLFQPQLERLPLPSEALSGFPPQSLLEVVLPLRVIRVGCSFDFPMPHDGGLGR